MDRNVEEYLKVRKSQERLEIEKSTIDLQYERRISTYRSSTVMVQKTWGATLIVSREELHYEEFL